MRERERERERERVQNRQTSRDDDKQEGGGDKNTCFFHYAHKYILNCCMQTDTYTYTVKEVHKQTDE